MVCGGEGIPPTAELCVFIRAMNMGIGSTGFLTCLSFIHDYFKDVPSPYEVAGTVPGNYE